LEQLALPKRADPSSWHPPLVVLAGVGMARSDIPAQTERWIDHAEILVGGERVLDWFPEHPGKRIPFQATMDPSLDEATALSANNRVLVLASGDPLFFGVGRRLVRRLGRERILVFPNINSVQALFARIAEPWEDVRSLSLHGRSGSDWLQEVSAGHKVALFTDPQHTPAWIAQQVADAGIVECRLMVGENLGRPDEMVRVLTVAEASRITFAPLNVVAILPGAANASEPEGAASSQDEPAAPVLGLDDNAFAHQAGLITKKEVRAVVLASLQLRPGLVLWDVGAGSGSVAVEAARLTKLGQVVAMEKDPDRFRQLLENIGQFGNGAILPVSGQAPQALRGLSDPDRVFIGGSGGELPAILAEVARRLRPQGRVVQTAVTLETLAEIQAFWRRQPFEVNIIQLQVNRSVPVGDALRLEALNPVFIVTAWRSA
jgi:precorrin-6Y C5,15-methyltransferase (decarboxylating)